ncbi:GNAT family N-acetyltransferase [Nocardioides sp. SYSU DS0663]|uniref:GNAT family N-acetyltransferase n=1 Tax=Nocardioides sp. SYSU DS0663 TaxID=3416445 RepID=UPI003F4B20B1
MAPPEALLRPATPADLVAVGEVYLAARAAAVPAMPPIARTPQEVRDHWRGLDLADGSRELWVAEVEGRVTGFAEVKGDWLDDLYVAPGAQRSGLGSALLGAVQALRPDGFSLWVFESNRPARTFYARRGLVELERTDGSANEERAPDIRMAWPGRDALGFLRRQVDEVDDELGELLARRAALTRAIQPHKADPARDPGREREVAERLARRAPALGVDRLVPVVDAIVTASLDAAR